MPRDFQINGEALVEVRFGGHISGQISPAYDLDPVTNDPVNPMSGTFSQYELGLTSDDIRITPRGFYRDIHADDFGGEQGPPTEVMWLGADINVRMNLYHYEKDVLDMVIAESMAGRSTAADGSFLDAGTLAPAGTLMGNYLELGASGNHLMRLIIRSPQLLKPYRIQAAYLAERPFELPLGTKCSQVTLNFRGIPYFAPLSTLSGEPLSSGRILWDNRSG